MMLQRHRKENMKVRLFPKKEKKTVNWIWQVTLRYQIKQSTWFNTSQHPQLKTAKTGRWWDGSCPQWGTGRSGSRPPPPASVRCAPCNHSNALRSMDLLLLTSTQQNLFLLIPEFHRQTGIYPLCLVSLALIPVFYSWCLPLCSHQIPIFHTQPQTGNQNLMTDCSLTTHTWTGQLGPWNCSLILWSALQSTTKIL